jgi:hypothetical protein
VVHSDLALPVRLGLRSEVIDAYEGAAIVDVHLSVAADGQDVANPTLFEIAAA